MLLNYNFQYEHYADVNTWNDVLSGAKYDISLDANDLIVHKLSFLVLLYIDGKFWNK